MVAVVVPWASLVAMEPQEPVSTSFRLETTVVDALVALPHTPEPQHQVVDAVVHSADHLVGDAANSAVPITVLRLVTGQEPLLVPLVDVVVMVDVVLDILWVNKMVSPPLIMVNHKDQFMVVALPMVQEPLVMV